MMMSVQQQQLAHVPRIAGPAVHPVVCGTCHTPNCMLSHEVLSPESIISISISASSSPSSSPMDEQESDGDSAQKNNNEEEQQLGWVSAPEQQKPRPQPESPTSIRRRHVLLSQSCRNVARDVWTRVVNWMMAACDGLLGDHDHDGARVLFLASDLLKRCVDVEEKLDRDRTNLVACAASCLAIASKYDARDGIVLTDLLDCAPSVTIEELVRTERDVLSAIDYSIRPEGRSVDDAIDRIFANIDESDEPEPELFMRHLVAYVAEAALLDDRFYRVPGDQLAAACFLYGLRFAYPTHDLAHVGDEDLRSWTGFGIVQLSLLIEELDGLHRKLSDAVAERRPFFVSVKYARARHYRVSTMQRQPQRQLYMFKHNNVVVV